MEVVVEEWGEGRSANHVGSGRRQPKTQFSRWRRSGIGPLLANSCCSSSSLQFSLRGGGGGGACGLARVLFSLAEMPIPCSFVQGSRGGQGERGIALGGKAVRFASKKP